MTSGHSAPDAPSALSAVSDAGSEVEADADAVSALAGDLRVSLTRAVRRLRFERSSEEITDGQYAVLAVLDRCGPMTPSALAEDQHVQPPPMSRLLNALVEAGLVRRDPHPTDGRQVVVSLTPAGQAEVVETRRRRDVWLARRLEALPPEEREALARAREILDRVIAR